MKKYLIAFSLFTILCSCSTEEQPEPPVEEPKVFETSLGLAGEITSVIETPLTRASSANLYAIQIYSSPNTEGSGNYTCYAYGLFDDISLIKVKLLSGYKYKFTATMIVDGRSKVQHNDTTFYIPMTNLNFGITQPYSIPLNNLFNPTTKEELHIKSGWTSLAVDNQSYFRPNTDRYYGELSDFVPSENGTATIPMKRVSFGLKLIAHQFTEGTIKIALENAPDLQIVYPATEISDIFTFNSCQGAYAAPDTYSENLPVSLRWIKSDGAIIPLSTQNIAFKRNKLTTITVEIKDSSFNNGIGINIETDSMAIGDSINIETGTTTDTPVTPGN